MPAAALTCPKCHRPVQGGATHCPADGTPLRADAMAFDDATVRRTPRSNYNQAGLADSEEDTDKGDAGGGDATVKGDPLIGKTLGDYVVQARLGNGGMGVVYRGEQPMIGKKVAIKVLRDEIANDPVQVKRLLDEARAVNSIRHRGIIDIFNFGQLPDGRHYVVMEYLEGEALDQFLQRRGALPVGEAIEILDEILAALGAGHGAGIIHRDFKPSNVFLVRQPDGSHYLKLLDFGLAKQAPAGTNVSAQTHTHLVVGTPEYIAPEQAKAQSVSPRTDIYAAGVVMFELLTGRLPFTASTPMEWMVRHVEYPAPAPSSVVGGIPKDLDALVLKMLDKAPEARPQSADIIRRELQRISRVVARQAKAIRKEDAEDTLQPGKHSDTEERELVEFPVTAGRKARPLLLDEAVDGAPRTPLQKRIKPGAAHTQDAPALGAEPKSQGSGPKKRTPAVSASDATLTAREESHGTTKMPAAPTMQGMDVPGARRSGMVVWIAAGAIVLIGLAVGAFFALRPHGEEVTVPRPPVASDGSEPAHHSSENPEVVKANPPPKPPQPPPSDDTDAVKDGPDQGNETVVAANGTGTTLPDAHPKVRPPKVDLLARDLERLERRVEREQPRTTPQMVESYLTLARKKVESAHSQKEREEAAASLKTIEKRLYPDPAAQ